MIEDLIIIIPTHNRQHYLNRVVKYYSTFPCKVVICDSSKEKAIVDCYDNITYRWVPQSSFYKKVLDVINETSAKFYALSPDDDFINKETLLEVISFLETHDDYSFGNGRQIRFKKEDHGAFYTSNSFNKLQGITSIEADGDKYLQYFYQHYQNILWSVFRKCVVKDAFESLNACNYANGNFVELSLSIEGLRNGRVYISERGFNYREVIEGEHWGSTTPSITYRNIQKDNSLKTEVNLFKKYYKNDKGFANKCLKLYLHVPFRERITSHVPNFIKLLYRKNRKSVAAVSSPHLEIYNDPYMFASISKALE